MLFNSIEFLLFLPVVFILYWFVFNRKLTWQNGLLLFASYFFYGWWSWEFMGLLALSTILDFFYGFRVASENRKTAKIFLWLSIINNLGILGIFKYYNFFAEQIQGGLELLGLEVNPVLLNIALPVGISFYTFHGMSYVFDIYRKQQKPITNFVDYAVFVSFFPLLVAGPIERANHLLPQVQSPRYFNYQYAINGSRLILWGMFKKVVIADGLAETADYVFNHYSELSAILLITGAIAFSFQIYCDFSGYSDIALGVARLFGFELLSNFRFPYFSRDVAEFWRRWHISLSSWFRDYLYIPLGGSKNGKKKAVRNTFIIFIVSGFWHGASWNFIAWGFVHACAFVPLLLLNRSHKNTTNVVAEDTLLPSFRELLNIILTFSFITLTWILFRSPTLMDAVSFIFIAVNSLILHPGQLFLLVDTFKPLYLALILIIFEWKFRKNHLVVINFRNAGIRYLIYLVLTVWIIAQFGENHTFIYFQF